MFCKIERFQEILPFYNLEIFEEKQEKMDSIPSYNGRKDPKPKLEMKQSTRLNKHK